MQAGSVDVYGWCDREPLRDEDVHRLGLCAAVVRLSFARTGRRDRRAGWPDDVAVWWPTPVDTVPGMLVPDLHHYLDAAETNYEPNQRRQRRLDAVDALPDAAADGW